MTELQPSQRKTMGMLFSNGPQKDFVINPYRALAHDSRNISVAAPYVTKVDDLIEAAAAGKTVQLLIGLNVVTSASALISIFGRPNISIRYFTRLFHAKVFVFDDAALVGSSNLTQGGLEVNREATLLVEGTDEVNEIRALFQELWSSASVLTDEKLTQFKLISAKFPKPGFVDGLIEDAVGRAEPTNLRVGSNKKTSEFLFLEGLRKRVYEQLLPAFREVSEFLQDNQLHRSEWDASDKGSETNRFLNWVRLECAPGDEWKLDKPRTEAERQSLIRKLGYEWAHTDKPRIAADYFEGLAIAKRVFGTRDNLQAANREELSAAFMAIHAFYEQIRFVKGGRQNLPNVFWEANNGDVDRVKRSLGYLLFGSGEFIVRLYELLNDPAYKIRYFAESCALELCGTVDPLKCPPTNGRSTKALRYIGYDVPA